MHLSSDPSPRHPTHSTPSERRSSSPLPMSSLSFAFSFPWQAARKADGLCVKTWAEVRCVRADGDRIVADDARKNELNSLSPVQKAAALDLVAQTFVEHRSSMPFNRLQKLDPRFISNRDKRTEYVPFNLMLVEGSVRDTSLLFFTYFSVFCRHPRHTGLRNAISCMIAQRLGESQFPRITHLVVSYIIPKLFFSSIP